MNHNAVCGGFATEISKQQLSLRCTVKCVLFAPADKSALKNEHSFLNRLTIQRSGFAQYLRGVWTFRRWCNLAFPVTSWLPHHKPPSSEPVFMARNSPFDGEFFRRSSWNASLIYSNTKGAPISIMSLLSETFSSSSIANRTAKESPLPSPYESLEPVFIAWKDHFCGISHTLSQDSYFKSARRPASFANTSFSFSFVTTIGASS